MSRRLGVLLACAVLALGASLPARADTNGTWVGNVTHASASQVDVSGTLSAPHTTAKPQRETRTFIIGSDFRGVRGPGGKHETLHDLKPKTFVRVSYRQATLFGSYHALEIDVLGSASIPIKTPAPGPYHP